MDAEFSLLNNAAKVTVSLTEFESIVKHLLGSSEREEVRIAVKELIAEVRKSGDTFVDVLKPLYALANAREFKKEFPTIRAHFKSYFLKEGDNLRTHCHIATQKLIDLKSRRRWMGSLPLIKRSFQRLNNLGTEWIANDSGLELSMTTFLNDANRIIERLERERAKNAKEGFAHLQEFLKRVEGDYKTLRAQLDSLRLISAKL